jgi:hypothetical protein
MISRIVGACGRAISTEISSRILRQKQKPRGSQAPGAF